MWDVLVAWFQSPGGARVLQTAIIPALAILVAGLLAALIARSAVRATIRRAERVEAASVVAGLVAAARLVAEGGDDGPSRRRAARLRTEADVRARLLPLNGAGLAADWAAARTDALQQRSGEGMATTDLDQLRDRLVEWVAKPSRARRIFVTPTPPPTGSPAPMHVAAATPDATSGEEAPTPGSAAAAEEPEAREQERPTRGAAAPGPRRTPPAPEPAPAVAVAAADHAAEPEPEPVVAAAAVSTAALAENLPAWQRTRAVERLQQERSRGRVVEPPTNEDEEEGEVRISTAPVALQRTHRAADALAAEAAEAVRLEAHQQARHARPDDQAAPATGAVAAATPTPAPAWLDTYDDEAQVTQNMDLKTPPPVAASAVRDRGAPGEDLVPRS